ncbi:MAG: Short-chain-enoyl-CoA hydratase [Alphaproteobacteria bacterium MarineAlpha2_Bin1]|nr:MAG: Short-chain-enoyl-CoA hydratase [Alphaproteobacteria bacterium MarineAlpha2_Bin1]|tara:strand:+ start:41 stop:820 length:780 start_codon:yes stop_codon:yes gene_type:complete
MKKNSIFLEKNGNIGWIILNQPDKRNAISKNMWELLPELLETAKNDKDIKVVVLRGAGEKIFAAGADISEFQDIHSKKDVSIRYNQIILEAEIMLTNFPKPTIAMIYGACVGGGCGLALACDLRFGDKNSKFSIPPANLGLVYSLHGTKLLIEKVGPSVAKDMLFSARFVHWEEAQNIRLLDKVFEEKDLKVKTIEYCNALSNKSSYTINSTKKIIQMILNGQTEDNNITLDLFNAAFTGDDYIEGTKAFLEKRKPNFN